MFPHAEDSQRRPFANSAPSIATKPSFTNRAAEALRRACQKHRSSPCVNLELGLCITIIFLIHYFRIQDCWVFSFSFIFMKIYLIILRSRIEVAGLL